MVVGIGHPDRGDDAAGVLVAEAVRSARPDLDVVCLADPLALVDVVAGRELAVVVDAAVAGNPVGTVLLIEAGESPLPQQLGRHASSSHGLSVGDAIELARTLGTLPPRVAVVTLEIGSVDLGEPAQPAVLGAVDQAAATVLRLVGRDGRERAGRT